MKLDRNAAGRALSKATATMCLLMAAWLSHGAPLMAQEMPPAGILVEDADTGWPVPLVQLTTTHQSVWVSDNAGWIAVDAPELLGHSTWFSINGHGYEVPADGFGMRGVRLTLEPGETETIQVRRTAVARRIGRLTGNGLFGESQKLGHHLDWHDSPVMGTDSVQLARHQDRLFWAWGDTNVRRYPLGVFDMTSATTPLDVLHDLQPPLKMQYRYFLDDQQHLRGVADMPGEGPTWLSGYVSLPDTEGKSRLCALYRKIENVLDTYEIGLCVWNDETRRFEHLKVLWNKANDQPRPTLLPGGQPYIGPDETGQTWVWFGNPLPTMRCPANWQQWQNPENWVACSSPSTLQDVASDRTVRLHAGSLCWNSYRNRFIAVFVERGGEHSFLGDVWYAESPSLDGPWTRAIRILSHDNYSFYNPRIHAERMSPDSTQLYFEGTYSHTFTDHAQPTPRYDYNQMLYRLDLDDPALDILH